MLGLESSVAAKRKKMEDRRKKNLIVCMEVRHMAVVSHVIGIWLLEKE